MKVKKQRNEFGLNIFLEEEDRYLAFTFGGNGDLYWSLHLKKENSNNQFVITKENFGIYRLFEQLYEDIESINIWEEDDFPFYRDAEEQRNYQEREKERYRVFHAANYDELFNEKEKTITWYSDETSHSVSNIVKIKKEQDRFKIEFYIQSHIDGYDEDFHNSRYIPIRFRNSGSSYDPFNLIFMRMYNEMKEVDDANEAGHQIHIEEYLYQRNKVKKLVK